MSGRRSSTLMNGIVKRKEGDLPESLGGSVIHQHIRPSLSIAMRRGAQQRVEKRRFGTRIIKTY